MTMLILFCKLCKQLCFNKEPIMYFLHDPTCIHYYLLMILTADVRANTVVAE